MISVIAGLICLTKPCTAAGRAGPLQAAPSSSCPAQCTPARCADPYRIKPSAKNKTTNSSSMQGDYPRNQVIFILELMPRNKRTNQLPPIISSREAASEETSSWCYWKSSNGEAWLLRICSILVMFLVDKKWNTTLDTRSQQQTKNRILPWTDIYFPVNKRQLEVQ